MLGILFTLLMGVGHFAIKEQTELMMNERHRSLEAVTRALALSAEPLITDTNNLTSSQLSQRIKNTDWDLRYLVIADESGQTLYAESSNMPPEEQPLSGEVSWRAIRTLLGYEGTDATSLYKATAAVRLSDDRWGTLTAGYSTARTGSLVNETHSRLMLVFALAMIVGVVCCIAFARSVTTPLRSVIRGAQAVSDGNLAYRVRPSRSIDEIAHLIEAFNLMINKISDTHQRLVEQVNTDSLTGLYSHRHFQERLKVEISRALRYNHPLSLLLINPDRFKAYNEEHGHAAGDAMLAEIGALLSRTFRDTDICVRYSGVEFAVLLPESDQEAARLAAERVRKLIEDISFDLGGASLSPTVSIGTASINQHTSDARGLEIAAGIALHRAKAEGGNKAVSYQSDSPAYPVVDPHQLYSLLNTGDMSNVEALADAIDCKHLFPAGHSRVVADLAVSISQKLGRPETETAATFLAGMLRDIGQIAIPDVILTKDGPLTDEERKIIATHPLLGQSILEKSKYLQSVLPGVVHHHERYDGSGYPMGLAAHDIPMMARVLSVADAYRAMVTARPHRGSMTPEEARKEIARCSKSQFDPAVVKAFLEIFAETEEQKEAA